ncbi:hypothetical protein HW555_012004 [Spodoptera exigua]|uniref:Uncharacterized protein n=1 Tax=Spodoptera exigua TaxID=7107 RepID=A0A835G4B5_SPOEX|nr:hypothetical protein HW555_012004 [Spodoptera exigua]
MTLFILRGATIEIVHMSELRSSFTFSPGLKAGMPRYGQVAQRNASPSSLSSMRSSSLPPVQASSTVSSIFHTAGFPFSFKEALEPTWKV